MSAFLVTGGAGFIGSHLCDRLLEAGHAVTVLDDLSSGKAENLPAAAKLVRGSITDAALVRGLMNQPGMAGCFHLAAISSVQRCTQDWTGTHCVNGLGTVTIFDAARATGSRAALPVVYVSSAAIYGRAEHLPIAETAIPAPLSAYGVDKLTGEMNARIASTIHGVPTIGLRFFNVFGPRQDPGSPYSGVVAIFASKLARGETPTIFGDGSQSRDFIRVEDAVAALVQAMARASKEPAVYNVCSGSGTSLLALGKMLAQIHGRAPAFTFAPAREGDIAHSVGDPSLCERILGLRPARVDIEALRSICAFTPA